MRLCISFALLLMTQISFAQVTLDANGQGDTYELITSVLAPDQNPIEVPDCGHQDFERHIDEVFDTELNDHAFRFLLHVEPDNDRCQTFDRQRNEIKSYSQSPDNLLGVEEEIVQYKWKFKLPEGFQPSGSFSHIHQLKSVGGPFAGHPMYTLTLRKSTPDRIELRYALSTSSVIIEQAPLEAFLDTWVEVTETITYGINGTYEISLNRLSDNAVLLSYANDDIVNWREDADFVRPKWGLYRSLNSAEDLRDEEVLFADFSIEELESLSIQQQELPSNEVIIYNHPDSSTLSISNISNNTSSISLYSISGQKMLDAPTNGLNRKNMDISLFIPGAYIIVFNRVQNAFSKIIIIK